MRFHQRIRHSDWRKCSIMSFNKLIRASVGAGSPCPSPIYRHSYDARGGCTIRSTAEGMSS
jgi:hypothetical protein